MTKHKISSNSGFSELFYIIIVAIVLTFAFFLIYTKQNSSKIIISSPSAPTVTITPTKGSSQKKYSCPNNEWVDCMPKVDRPPSFQCEKQYLNWAKINCPNFKGAAL